MSHKYTLGERNIRHRSFDRSVEQELRIIHGIWIFRFILRTILVSSQNGNLETDTYSQEDFGSQIDFESEISISLNIEDCQFRF